MRYKRFMKTADRKVLEKIFTAEINGRLPCQLKSKHLPRLEQENLICQIEERLGGRFPITIKGWALTEYGRMMYCASCK